MFLTIKTNAQYNQYLIKIEPDSFCINQKIKITIHLDSLLLQHPTYPVTISDSIGNNVQPYFIRTRQEWADSNYSMIISANQIGNPGTAQKLGIWDMVNDSKKIFQKNCFYDIENNKEKLKLIETKYYNIFGIEIEKQTGLLIKISKYSNGFIEVKKVLSL